MDVKAKTRILLFLLLVLVGGVLLWEVLALLETGLILADGLGSIRSMLVSLPVEGKHLTPFYVHQVWKNKNCSTYPAQNFCDQWQTQALSNGWQYRLWNDTEIFDLFQSHLPAVLDRYLTLTSIQRADLARYLVLWIYGGVYADLDVRPGLYWQNLTTGSTGSNTLILMEGSDLRTVSNHFMVVTSPGLSFFFYLFHQTNLFHSSIPYVRVMRDTGPIFLTQTVKSYLYYHIKTKTDNITRMYIIPKSERELYAQHESGRSWHQFDGYLFNKIADDPVWVAQGMAILLCGLCVLYICKRTSTIT